MREFLYINSLLLENIEELGISKLLKYYWGLISFEFGELIILENFENEVKVVKALFLLFK